MSNAKVNEPIADLSQLDPDGIYTYSDYLYWKFKERVELIRGRIFRMSPAPNTEHQRIALRLKVALGNFFEENPCQVFPAPFDVRLPRQKSENIFTVVQPDLCVICDPGKLDEKGCIGAPDLLVEILSPGNSRKELRDKYEVYEDAGVREYWIVNPREKIVLVYILDKKGKFIGLQPLTDEQTLEAAIFPGLKVDLGELFAEPTV
jgi:Uma2 family endonuclease